MALFKSVEDTLQPSFAIPLLVQADYSVLLFVVIELINAGASVGILQFSGSQAA